MDAEAGPERAGQFLWAERTDLQATKDYSCVLKPNKIYFAGFQTFLGLVTF